MRSSIVRVIPYSLLPQLFSRQSPLTPVSHSLTLKDLLRKQGEAIVSQLPTSRSSLVVAGLQTGVFLRSAPYAKLSFRAKRGICFFLSSLRSRRLLFSSSALSPFLLAPVFSLLPYRFTFLLLSAALFNFATSRTVSARNFPGATSKTNGPNCTRLIFSTRYPTL